VIGFVPCIAASITYIYDGLLFYKLYASTGLFALPGLCLHRNMEEKREKTPEEHELSIIFIPAEPPGK